MPNEQEQFLKDIGKEHNEDPFAHLNNESEQDQKEPEKDEEERKEDDRKEFRNRRERRLAAKLQAEREAGIELAAKLEAITSSQKDRNSEAADYLKSVERIYGTESPETREATEILKQALKSVKDQARDEALEAYNEVREREESAVQDAETMLDDMIEQIEDEYNIDLSSQDAENSRVGFFKLLERMSPKDSDGNIRYYADHFSVWEEYQERNKKVPDDTAKNLASRSMTQSGGQSNDNLTAGVNERWLKENDLI